MSLTSINPTTGELLHRYAEHASTHVEALITRGADAAAAWGRLAVADRTALWPGLAHRLRQDPDRHAELMALEMGKPVGAGRAEIEKCALVCDYYAAHGERLLAPELITTDWPRSYVAFRPLGLVLAIMPWNFPFWQVFRAAVPALTAGNGLLLKHASNVSGCALAIEQLFLEAGVPEGVLQTLLLESSRVEALIGHPAVRGVTVTGSVSTGRTVAAAAGRALKKTVLELGGSDPYLVLEDADVAQAAEVCAAARLINAGQSCVAAKRFLVVSAVREAFEAGLVRRMAAQVVGDPRDPSVTVGPMARRDLRDALHAQVQATVARGARLLTGGARPDGPGAFYPPTVLTDVPVESPAFAEETFGPVAAVVPVADVQEAVRLANATPFGLGAAVFTADRAHGEALALQSLEAGFCAVNAPVRSDPRLPFGGVKASGYGRELAGCGVREFVNVKTIVVA